MTDPKLRDIHERINEFKSGSSVDCDQKKRTKVTSFTIAVDLVSGTLVGVMMGVILDELFSSRPLFLLLCMMFGVIAGINIIRTRI